MKEITDEYMKQLLPTTKTYSLVILKPTAKVMEPGAEKIIWEHGRRNFAMRDEGLLQIVCPVPHHPDVAGVGIFTGSIEETTALMDEDPGVKAGLFTFSVFACRSFPGDTLK